MSRIHEALRKAEMEVTILEAARSSSVLEPRANPAPPAQKNVSQPASLEPAPLEFDQLVKACPHFQWRLGPNANVFEATSDTGGCAEQFRSLRSKLYQIRKTQPLRTLLITSAASGEGKTFVLTNLAEAIVRQPGSHVLVIDADLRRSNVHKALGAPSAPGLTEYLRGEAGEFGVIQVRDFGPKSSLCLIPGGGKVNNPTELLSNGRMKELLNRVIPAFDWVIIDSPPCVPVADAGILADISDGLLFVVRSGVTPSSLVQKARQELPKSKIIGVLLNAIEGKGAYKNYKYGD